MAIDFQAMQPKLLPVETIEAMRSAWVAGRTPIWLPWTLVQHEATIPQDWSITSDGLAAWLAGKLHRAEVALVKSCAVPPGAALNTLAASGITDQQFPAFVARGHLRWHVLGVGDEVRLDAILAGRA